MAGLDDLTQTTIESIIIYNNLEIITKLEEDDVFLSAVYEPKFFFTVSHGAN